MIGIKAIAPHIAGAKTALAALPEKAQLQGSQLDYFNSVGIDSVYIEPQYKGYDFARVASAKVLEETGLEGSDIDLIIFIKSRLPEAFIVSEAARLQNDLGAENALAYTTSDLGCTDMSMAIKQAHDFLQANDWAEHVLICYGCKPGAPHRYRHPVTVNGDGGLALIIGRTEDNQILDVELKIDGSYWNLFKMVYQDKVYENYKEELSDERRYGFELALESRNRFLELNENILERNELNKTDIDHFILQNISARAYQFYEAAYEIQIAPVCSTNLARYGHLGPADVMLNYAKGLSHGFFQKGQKVMVMNNSPVAAWSSILIEV
ncbi:MAG: 3-oxoacyl-[acyl-carrier-protein] synthase III C-terminal domain-containing protein [Bacteroidota bacterium]